MALPPDVDADALRTLYYACNDISLSCPVEATTLGYFPSRDVNSFFAVSYTLAALVTLGLGIWRRTWSYSIFISAGCLLEVVGYCSRIPLSTNPWNKKAFETQIVAIILAPTLVCISIYLTLKHVCLSLNPELSRVRPHLYPFIFVPLDVSCLLVQAVGGALAATAGYDNPKLIEQGNRAIIAGITLQVVVLLFFGLAVMDYYVRVRRWIKGGRAGPEAMALWQEKRFKMFMHVVSAAYGGILVRCIYRIAEMARGWGNPIMRDEFSYIVLEGFMVLIPCVLLAVFPPGILFPQMAARMSQSARARRNPSPSESQMAKRSSSGTESGGDASASEKDLERD